jgi:hypothetical protein
VPFGPPWRARAVRLLRLALPLCLIAAALVAGQGLLRVVGRPAAGPSGSATPSLELGRKAADSTPLNQAAPAAIPTPTPAPTPFRPEAASTPIATMVTQPVAVFNASAVSGLARRTAAQLRARGISVTAIGNVAQAHRPGGRTVFYAPGQSVPARALATLTGAAAAPAPSWLEAKGRLVLVLTDTGAVLTSS